MIEMTSAGRRAAATSAVENARLALPQPSEHELRECAEEPIRVPGAVQPWAALVAYDASGRVTRASENLEAVTGVPAREALGRPAAEVLDLTSVDPEGRRVAALDSPAGALEAAAHRVDDETVVELASAGDADRLAAGGAELFARLLDRLRPCEDLEGLCETVAGEVRGLTGYDRVMIYRFDADWNGQVFAEARREGMEPFLGLHYPASDIPAQARALYLETPVRVLGDVAYEPAELLAPPGPLPAEPLDMSRCLSRSMSPIHRTYLANMGVSATLVASLSTGGRLWGLISCHHGSPRRPGLASLRTMAVVSELASGRVREFEDRARGKALAARADFHARVLSRIHTADDLSGELARTSRSLMRLMDAEGVAMRFGERLQRFGEVPGEDDLRRLFATLEERPEGAADGPRGARAAEGLFVTDSLARDLPQAGVDDPRAAGVVAMEFWPQDFIAFFRPAREHAVRWGGRPAKAVERDDRGRLLPRSSFAEWVQNVSGTSRPWSDVDVSAAEEFRSALAVFVIRRSRELADLNRQLARRSEEVQQFVYSISHDLKSPLVTARGFVGLIREDLEAGDLDEVRDSLERIERATETMNAFIADLLEFSRIGRDGGGKLGPVDLASVAAEAVDQAAPQAQACGAEVVVEPGLPTVTARRTDLLRVFSNLIDNALKYACDCPGGRIEISCDSSPVEHVVSVRDHGPGIPEELHEKAMRLFQRLRNEKTGTGVGLSSVAKAMEAVGGRAWLANPEGGGLAVRLSFPRRVRARR